MLKSSFFFASCSFLILSVFSFPSSRISLYRFLISFCICSFVFRNSLTSSFLVLNLSRIVSIFAFRFSNSSFIFWFSIFCSAMVFFCLLDLFFKLSIFFVFSSFAPFNVSISFCVCCFAACCFALCFSCCSIDFVLNSAICSPKSYISPLFNSFCSKNFLNFGCLFKLLYNLS